MACPCLHALSPSFPPLISSFPTAARCCMHNNNVQKTAPPPLRQLLHISSHHQSQRGEEGGAKKRDEMRKYRKELRGIRVEYLSSSIIPPPPAPCGRCGRLLCACCGAVLLSTVSQRWFCLIGWFATSLLIDNRRRETLISPSAEWCS